jgi:predicted PurR-regulated permease PerM
MAETETPHGATTPRADVAAGSAAAQATTEAATTEPGAAPASGEAGATEGSQAAETGSESDRNGMPRWIPKLLFMIAVGGFLAYAAFLTIRQLRDLILWLIAALFLSFAVEPAVNWLIQRGWRRGVATGVILFGTLILLGILFAAMVPLVIDQVQQLANKAPAWLAQANVYTKRWFNVELTNETILNWISESRSALASAATQAASVGALMLSALFQVLTISLFTFYLVADGPRFRRTVCSVLPQQRQLEVLRTWELAIDKTGGYIYSRLLLAVANSLASYVALKALDVPYALPLALWQGLVSQFIPVVGTYLGAAVPLLVALLSDPWSALYYLIFVVVYQQVENYLLSPRITARTMQLHPAVAFAAALGGASLGGFLGALIALPAAAVIQATVSSYLTRHEVVDTDLTREQTAEGPAERKPRRGLRRRPDADGPGQHDTEG